MDILSMEEFAFSLLNQLADEYGIFDKSGDFARAIQETTDTKEMQSIINQLQALLLNAMRLSIPKKPEFSFGEFDNGNHWQGVF